MEKQQEQQIKTNSKNERIISKIKRKLFELFADKTPDQFIDSPTKEIIDMHIHTAWIWINSDCFIANELKDSFKYPIYLKSFQTNHKEVSTKWDGIVLSKISEKIKNSKYVRWAVVLALDWVINENWQLDKDKTQTYIPNDFLATELEKYDNLYLGASINPNRPNALELLEENKSRWAVLIKWLPSIQNIDPNDNKFIPFYQKLIELDLPLLVHVWNEDSFKWANNELSNPNRLRLPLSLWVKVIAAHVWASWKSDWIANEQKVMKLMEEFPNLYADISSLTQINKLWKLKKVIADQRTTWKLMYGSDFPLINIFITSPIYFIKNLWIRKLLRILLEKNVWDRDILLKYYLWLGQKEFDRSKTFLNIK